MHGLSGSVLHSPMSEQFAMSAEKYERMQEDLQHTEAIFVSVKIQRQFVAAVAASQAIPTNTKMAQLMSLARRSLSPERSPKSPHKSPQFANSSFLH